MSPSSVTNAVSFLPKPNYLPSIASMNLEDDKLEPLPTLRELHNEGTAEATVETFDESQDQDEDDDEDEEYDDDEEDDNENNETQKRKSLEGEAKVEKDYPKEKIRILNALGNPIYDDPDDEVDRELENNTLYNATMYQLSQEEVDTLESVNQDEERLILSPEYSSTSSPLLSPTVSLSDTTQTLQTTLLAGSESSVSATRISVIRDPSSSRSSIRESSSSRIRDTSPVGANLLPHHHLKKQPTPLANMKTFQKGISFDNLSNDNRINTDKLQFTLTTKHLNFKFDRTSRTFMCGYDENECSLVALKWAIDDMLSDGDTLVCLRVITKESSMALDHSSGKFKKECEKILEDIAKLNKKDKKIKIVLEFKIGKVPEMITKAIKDYDPKVLIVGTRGVHKSGFKAMISSKSMSKYCLQYAKVPVAVVNPSYEFTRYDRKMAAKNSVSQTTEDVSSNFFRDKVLLFNSENEKIVPDNTSIISSDSSRKPRFMRMSSSGSYKRDSSRDNTLSPSRSRGFSPARTLSPFKLFKKKSLA